MTDTEISHIIIEFQSLGINNVYEVANLQYWLSKYEALYESLIEMREIEFNTDGYCNLDLLTDSERPLF
jgi:hypothetical protein